MGSDEEFVLVEKHESVGDGEPTLESIQDRLGGEGASLSIAQATQFLLVLGSDPSDAESEALESSEDGGSTVPLSELMEMLESMVMVLGDDLLNTFHTSIDSILNP